MKTYKELMESKGKLVTVKSYDNPKDFEILYTFTDGKSFSLSNDKSVFFANFKDKDLKIDGKPNCKNIEYYVMEFQKKLGIYDSNMKLIHKFKNIKDLEKNINDILEGEEITIEGWD